MPEDVVKKHSPRHSGYRFGVEGFDFTCHSAYTVLGILEAIL